MSWDNIIIGKGNIGCTTVRVFQIKGNHSISDNAHGYRISNLICGLGMTLFKDTKEGRQLTKMIAEDKSADKIYEYLNKVALTKVKPAILQSFIKNSLDVAYQRGKDDKLTEIQHFFGIKQ